MSSEEQKSGLIFTLIPEIMKEIGAISKGRKNAQQGYAYRGIEDIYEGLQKIMAEKGVFTVPKRVARQDQEWVSDSGKKFSHSIITYRYRFYASDGSYFDAEVDGEGMDNNDKASGKCASYAHKVTLVQVFCIPTQDSNDPDAESPKTQEQASSVKKPAQTKPGAPSGAPAPKVSIDDIKFPSGTYSGKTFKEVLGIDSTQKYSYSKHWKEKFDKGEKLSEVWFKYIEYCSQEGVF